MADISAASTITAKNTVSSSGNGKKTREAKNALTLEDFYKLMAVQLQNQDMTSPMDNSEMLNQMVQMATIESMSQMTQMTTNQYAASLLGQEAEIQTIKNGKQEMVKGTVTGVNLAYNPPVLYLDGKPEEYSISTVVAVGKISTGTDTGPGSGPEDKEDTVSPTKESKSEIAEKPNSKSEIAEEPNSKSEIAEKPNSENTKGE